MKSFPKLLQPSLLVIFLLISSISSAQEHCDTPEDEIADPNSITKCAVEEVKGADGSVKKQVAIEVSTRRRVVRKNKTAVSVLATNKSEQQIASIKNNSLIVGKLELEDSEDTLEKIPFNLVEEIPLFSKCVDVPFVKQVGCFEEQMSAHIKKHFNYPKKAMDAGIEGRVLVQFTIDELGKVFDIRTRVPKGGELLGEEAERIIKKLPTFEPGKQQGKIVKVKYGIPIGFKIPGSVKKDNLSSGVLATSAPVKKPVVKEAIITDFVKFNKVQTIPLFKACVKVADDKKMECFNTRMMSHIQRNFNYPQKAAEENIQGKVWVSFIIDKNGEVKNVKSRGPKNGILLEKEAERMVKKLAKFKPGFHEGKITNVQYTIPINFRISAK
ncbi:energy transducer TonB [Tenacibaculum sp. SG-28]|uniref:energy transducer TonB n=1 Tax=Tenacibaculum sp. SG-28 TaxID=754426 RepID=UPI000CF4F0D9|nr:energy transducer TonB [Tenacibaculum sp. SG-28]PQJ23063.1 hypothetical protein BSU00_02040 [Tenacibaculum sp. SG-28]